METRRRERSVVRIRNVFVFLWVVRECERGDRGVDDGEWRGLEVIFVGGGVVVCSMMVAVCIVIAPIVF